MNSYSQYGEDSIFVPLLPEHGWLLDIGAHGPVTFSNSRALIEAGWSAVLVEPSPGPLRELVRYYGERPEERARVSIIGAAVGIEHGHLLDLAITDDMVSTSNEAVALIWAKDGGYIGRAFIPTIAMNSISNQFGHFDFVSIDAEGQSVDLAVEMFRIGWRPKVVCCEHDGRPVELMQAATPCGYVMADLNGTNAILERR